MPNFLTKDADIEAIKSNILTALSRRNFEADGLLSRLPWKGYHIEMALHYLIQEGRLVSYWTDSGSRQRKYYALIGNFDTDQQIMQICASSQALEELGEINLTSRQEIQEAEASGGN